jgi:hypothetical protein
MKPIVSVSGRLKMTRKGRERGKGMIKPRVLRLTNVKEEHIVGARERTSGNHMELWARVPAVNRTRSREWTSGNHMELWARVPAVNRTRARERTSGSHLELLARVPAVNRTRARELKSVNQMIT